MTLTEMLDEVKKSLGNRTDIDNERYVRWLNWAQYNICGMHRERIIPPKRFHELEDDIYFRGVLAIEDCGATVTASTFQVSGADEENDPDFYNGALVEITGYTGDAPDGLVGQKRLIVDYSGAPNFICTIHEDWTVNPDTNTEYTIYRRKYYLGNDFGISAHERIRAIERIERLSDNSQIKHKGWDQLVGIMQEESGSPAFFCRHGNAVFFDVHVETTEWMHLYYYRIPVAMTETGPVNCELPEEWHEIVIAGAIHRGFRKLMEPLRASEAKKRFVEMAADLETDFTVENANVTRSVRMKITK